jgi:bifunctional non-homologous end joining protein LigD
MLAKIGDKPFDSDDWVFEIKYDGYRALALIDQNVDLISRNNLSFNKIFAPLLNDLKKLKHSAILDGEVVIENAKGVSDFNLLQNYQRSGAGILKYYVFDILMLDENDIRNLPLLKRKELLKLLIEKQNLKQTFFSKHIKKNGIQFYKQAIKQGLEGIIAKNEKSLYYSGKRSNMWLKIKINQEEEAIIIGLTAPQGNRKEFGALLLGAYKNGILTYIGNCGTGFSDVTLKEVYTKLQPYFIAISPLKENITLNKKVQWVKPKLICQIKFSEWTKDGFMRHPVFMGFRIDKKANEVMITAEENTLKKSSAYDIQIEKKKIHITNPQKIYFPDDQITKNDIIKYYDEISPIILPYLINRPESMNRFPNGITGEHFFQKDVDADKIPEWIKTKKIYSESNSKFVNYILCNNKATLLYMANLGCIELNPWNSQIARLENPDWAVIDLDPEDIAFKEVVKAALQVKKIMDQVETECYCKTSGATGLHIFIPLAKKYNYDVVKSFAELIAHNVFASLPATTSIIRNPQKRQQKVYLDFLQNRKGQTLAAPYSVRPRLGASVSTPLEWHEVNNKLDPGNFTIKTIFKRLDKKGDLWKPVIEKGADIEKIINHLNVNL